MTQGKTPEEIIDAFDIKMAEIHCMGRFGGNIQVEENRQWFRQALADVVRWAAENMAMPSDYAMFIDKNGNRIRSSKDRLLALADQIDKEMTI